MSQWTPNERHEAAEATKAGLAKDERDTQTALRVLEMAVRMRTAETESVPPTTHITTSAESLAAYAEILWQWTTTDTWPPKQ